MELRERLAQALGDAYRIDRELPPGGMSRLFLATERSLDRTVVVKLLPPEFSSEVSVTRFRREIELSAKLQHPHIVPLLSMGTGADGLLYYIMPYVPGESLRTRLGRSGALPVDEALRLLLEMTDAVAHAHRHGVVHRDIKPENVLLQHGHAVLTDFGVARAFSEARQGDRITGTGFFVGTLGYMAPEQLAGDPLIDERADVYALGVVGHEMLAGKPPFGQPEARALAAAHLVTPPPALPELRRGVSPEVAQVIERALAKDPGSRWKSAGDMRDALRTAIGAPRRGWRPSRRLAAIGAAVVLVAAMVLLATTIDSMPRRYFLAPADVSDQVIAVLPFRVAGSERSLNMLREGMVDLIAAKLSSETGPRAVDPRAVLSAWRRVNSDPETDLQLTDAMALARQVGAGRLILGSVVGTPERVTISATLRATRGDSPPVAAEVTGPLDSLPSHVEKLVASLLAREAGQREPHLTASLPALQLYLEGVKAQRAGHYLQAAKAFDAALDADSNFVRAALGLYEAGDWMFSTVGRRYTDRARATLWRQRETLTSRQRLEVATIVGPRYPLPLRYGEVLQALERSLAAGNDRVETWYRLADVRYHWGPVMGDTNAQATAERYYRKVVSLDSGYVPALEHLAEIGWARGDTSEANRLARAYLGDTTAAHHHYLRWRLALATRDTAELRVVRSRMTTADDESLIRIMSAAVQEQLPLTDADLAARTLREHLETGAVQQPQMLVAYGSYLLTRGQPAAASAAWRALGDPQGPVNLFPILSALHSSGDTALAREALAVTGARFARPWSDDPGRRRGRINALCAHAIWAYRHGDLATMRRLRADLAGAPIANDTNAAAQFHAPVCAAALDAIEAVHARRADARELVDRLDDLARTNVGDFQAATYNPVVAVLYEQLGDLRAAIAATRRWPTHPHGTLLALPADRIRDEGRLRATLGDTTGAIRAWQHYLFLRADAESSVQPEVERVRAALAALQRARG